MTQSKIFMCLTQAPNTAMQICRNKGVTLTTNHTQGID